MKAVMIAHASIDEHGRIANGKPGDQTGREVCIRTWYNKPWHYIIRFNNKEQAQKVAYAMTAAANNPCIGYNQNKRNTALQLASHAGYDPAKIKEDCDTDCSAITSLACIYAGVPEKIMTPGGNSCTTRNLRQTLEKTGLVTVYSSPEYIRSTDKLQVGDILLSEGHHVAVVVEVEGQTPAKKTAGIKKVAQDVIQGKYGMGNVRTQNLIKAGYNPTEVQAEVNRIMRG